MNKKGFTLAELLITVAIIGILAAIAVPNYSRYMQRGRMAEAYGDIQTIALISEKRYADKSSYADWTTLQNTYGLSVQQNQRHYNLAFIPNPPVQTFIITATPVGNAWPSTRIPCMTNLGLQGYMNGGACVQADWEAR